MVTPPQTKITQILIHFHGGGFCCHDSSVHQNYTRRWSRDCNVPVFSVDYRLAPKHAYPVPINDCYQAYVWIVTQAKEFLGLDIEHIIVGGDSAGGHITTAVSLLAAARGFRVPDAIVPIYPVFSIDISTFYPSLLLSIDEEILSQHALNFFLKCFKAEGDASRDPILSPLYAPNFWVKKLPPMKLFPSEICSLRD